MTTVEQPYFMENEEWYYFDEEEWLFRLTDKATKEAIESYHEFYRMLEDIYINDPHNDHHL